MDISQLDTVSEDDGVAVHLKDANDDPMYADEAQTEPLVLTVAGVYSSYYRAVSRKETEKAILKARRSGPKTSVDVEELEDSRIREQAACIRQWPFKSGGKPYPITADNWKALLAKQPQWQAQVHEAMHDHARFFKRS